MKRQSPLFQRRHYEVLAQVMVNHGLNANLGIQDHIIAAMKADNPLFDEGRFIAHIDRLWEANYATA